MEPSKTKPSEMKILFKQELQCYKEILSGESDLYLTHSLACQNLKSSQLKGHFRTKFFESLPL